MSINQKFRKIYAECSSILKKIVENRSSLKNEVYKHKDSSSYLAIMERIIQNYDTLVRIVKESGFSRKDEYYSIVLCSEILNGKVKSKYWTRKLEEVKGEDKLVHKIKQKYFRINTIKGSLEDIEGLEFEKTPIPNVFKLLKAVDLSKNSSFLKGKFTMQNISSCIPAYILNPEENSNVIDACAAPGNKTSHLAGIMNNTGKINAIEVDKRRFKILKEQMKKFGIRNIKFHNTDFTETCPEDFSKVDYILLDPSCSGSGVHSLYKKDDERLENLKKFQISMLKHACKFNPKKIVYSTCSIHKEEGEDVVEEAIKDFDYEVVDLKQYKELEGIEGLRIQGKFIRCISSPEEKGTIGFFVALLEKRNK